jgi:hypothetical protein
MIVRFQQTPDVLFWNCAHTKDGDDADMKPSHVESKILAAIQEAHQRSGKSILSIAQAADVQYASAHKLLNATDWRGIKTIEAIAEVLGVELIAKKRRGDGRGTPRGPQ